MVVIVEEDIENKRRNQSRIAEYWEHCPLNGSLENKETHIFFMGDRQDSTTTIFVVFPGVCWEAGIHPTVWLKI